MRRHLAARNLVSTSSAAATAAERELAVSPRYRTIVADPPWDHNDGIIGNNANGTGKTVRRPLPYPTMTVQEIQQLQPLRLGERDCNMFLWTTSRYLPAAFTILCAWGCRYRQTLVWHKSGYPPLTGGIAPTSLEFLLYATGRSGAGILHKLPDSLISTKRLANSHSRKPEVFLDLVEQVSPGPYLELFARRQRLGWDTWGDQALEHVQVG